MFIKIKKPWDTIKRALDEEAYLSRRDFLKKSAGYGLTAGIVLYGGATLAGLPSALASNLIDGAEKPQKGHTYPAIQNPGFTLDRPLTDEAVAAKYNNYYEFSARKNVWKYVEGFKNRPWTITISGLVKRPGVYDVDKLTRRIGLEERLYRFRCVEAWAMAVPWTGFPLKTLIDMVEPSSKAKYIVFQSKNDKKVYRQQRIRFWLPWPYTEGLTMAEAMNELSFMATGIYGHELPAQHGAPIRLVTPWKYGFKNIKAIVSMEFTDKKPETFWNTIAPNEYGFTSNVDPKVPHPRWSQATEKMLGTGERRKTMKYNGYGEFVAGLYK